MDTNTQKKKRRQLWLDTVSSDSGHGASAVPEMDVGKLTEVAKQLRTDRASKGQETGTLQPSVGKMTGTLQPSTDITTEIPTSTTAQLKQEALDAYLNREDFNYDFNADALYQLYKNRYLSQGKMAMEDTMGQAAALTGGYGSSYAQHVGQQAYHQYLQELHDVIPELYQLAYDRYQNEGKDLYQRYALLDEQEQTEYDRERDAVADQQWDQEQQEKKRQFDLGYALDQAEQEEDKRQFDLGYALDQAEQEEDKRQFDLGYALDQAEQEEDKRQFDLGYALDQAEQEEDKRQFDLGYALDQAEQEEDKRQFDQTHALAQSKANSGNNQYSDGYYAWLSQLQGKGQRADANDPTSVTKYDNGEVTTGDIMAMQQVIGVEPDGMWSKESQKAAGGLTADEAWAAYQKGQLQIRQSVALGDMGVKTADIRAMERALGVNDDGVWSSEDAKGVGGLSSEEAWILFQRGLLQNR